MGTEVKNEYGADQIQILEGLEAVRKRPGMYIGSTSTRGLHHLVYEIVDNAVDEALAGYCTEIEVTINKDNSIKVIDNGRGIPVGINHKAGLPAVEVVFTILHAGGKFGGGGYKVSGGLHGVGASVVNALSEWLEVTIHQNGKMYRQRYERGKVMYPLKEIGETDHTGTEVVFLPDKEIFEETVFDYDTLRQRLREMAFLTKGLKIILIDRRLEEPKIRSFHYEGGIKEYVSYLNKQKDALYEDVIYCEGQRNDIYVEVAMQHNSSYQEGTYSFVNNITTPEGGTHLTGFRNALTKTFNDYAKKNKLQTIAVGAPQFWCDKFLVVSPLEVLDYFYYADCVVTDTFHGSIFSIINNCKFATILRKSNENKLGGLLRELGLEDRIVDSVDNLSEILEKNIDYAKISTLLEKERVRTREYLTEQIESIK
mgnify:CR=1 FL=1